MKVIIKWKKGFESLLIALSSGRMTVWRRLLRRYLYDNITHRRSFMDIRDEGRYTLLREHGDVHWMERDGIWLITGFYCADQVLQDQQGFVKIRQTAQLDRYNMFQLAPPAEHARMQRFLMAAFTKKILAEDSEYISSLASKLFESLPRDVDIDLHREFSVIISYHSVCRFLGIESNAVRDALARYAPRQIDLSFPDYFISWLRSLLLEPESGDSQRFVNVLRRSISEGIYTHDEAYELLNIVWNGFMGTTPIMLSLLFEHIARFGLKGDAEGLGDDSWTLRLTDEVLRIRPVILKIIRRATRDSCLGGMKIRENDRVLIDLKMVNRDCRHFVSPEVFSVDDNRQRHLSFGAGAHRCMGMQMARHSARFILAPLADQLKSLEFIESDWMDMETTLTFIHYPVMTKYRINSSGKINIHAAEEMV